MSYLALYRKYRPSNFEDMVGQNEVVGVIRREILNDRISHAYLFAGPRGTGKTSTAKIMARMVNCENLSSTGEPCGICNSCKNFNASSDVVEIDAASNNGVDEIRELRDKVNLVPTSSRYKVYIIDEVHMLTTQAFNALLKTLEEPPGHVIFILATTEFFKIPVTVVSRCQKFQFSRVSNTSIVSRLRYVADCENITVDDDTLFEIARLSDGGMRDAINMLDQLSSFGENVVKRNDVYQLSGTFSYDDLYYLICYIFDRDFDNIISFCEEVNVCGKNVSKFIEELLTYIRDVLYYKTSGNFKNLEDDNIKKLSNLYSIDNFYRLMLFLNDLLSNIKTSSVPYVLLGVSLIKISNSMSELNNVVEEKKVNEVKIVNKKDNDIIEENKDDAQKKVTNVTSSVVFDEKKRQLRINNTFSNASKEKLLKLKESWHKLDELLFDDNYGTVVGLLKDVDIIVVGEKNIMLLAKYDSLVERLYAQIKLIEELLYNVFNIEYKVVFLASDEWKYEKAKYIDNLKNGYQYVYKEEFDEESLKNTEVEVNDIDKIIDIIGSEKIEYI